MKTRFLTLGTAISLLAVVIFAMARTDVAVAGDGPPPDYLALGDSTVVGVGASDPATTGYVPLLFQYLRTQLQPGSAQTSQGALNGKAVKLRNLAVSGETSGTFILDGQLDAALTVLRERNGNNSSNDDVRVVTLSIGGNDVAALFTVCGSSPAAPTSAACQEAVQTTIGQFSQNFPSIVGQFRLAAGPDTSIVVMTYYNALAHPSCPFHAFQALGDQILEGLNRVITVTATAVPNVLVADAASLGLTAAELQPDCRHPNDAGYERIAGKFIEALGG